MPPGGTVTGPPWAERKTSAHGEGGLPVTFRAPAHGHRVHRGPQAGSGQTGDDSVPARDAPFPVRSFLETQQLRSSEGTVTRQPHLPPPPPTRGRHTEGALLPPALGPGKCHRHRAAKAAAPGTGGGVATAFLPPRLLQGPFPLPSQTRGEAGRLAGGACFACTRQSPGGLPPEPRGASRDPGDQVPQTAGARGALQLARPLGDSGSLNNGT